MTLFSIGTSGLAANQLRLRTAAENIVNANSAGSKETVFRPQQTVTQAAPQGNGVIARQEPINPASFSAFLPDHPEADANGTVEFPNVSLEREIVELKQAELGYKASLKLVEVADEIADNLIDSLGRNTDQDA